MISVRTQGSQKDVCFIAFHSERSSPIHAFTSSLFSPPYINGKGTLLPTKAKPSGYHLLVLPQYLSLFMILLSLLTPAFPSKPPLPPKYVQTLKSTNILKKEKTILLQIPLYNAVAIKLSER